MLEDLRKLIGSRFHKRYQVGLQWEDRVTPFVRKKLDQLDRSSRDVARPVCSGRDTWEVTQGSVSFIINLKKRTCGCEEWQITGLPCKHAIRVIKEDGKRVEDYVEQYFTVESYRQLYDNIINPVPDFRLWDESTLPQLDPPFELRRMGRPSKHKRRESQDGSMVNKQGTKRCSNCKTLGHTKKSCGLPRDHLGKLIARTRRRVSESGYDTSADAAAVNDMDIAPRPTPDPVRLPPVPPRPKPMTTRPTPVTTRPTPVTTRPTPASQASTASMSNKRKNVSQPRTSRMTKTAKQYKTRSKSATQSEGTSHFVPWIPPSRQPAPLSNTPADIPVNAVPLRVVLLEGVPPLRSSQTDSSNSVAGNQTDKDNNVCKWF